MDGDRCEYTHGSRSRWLPSRWTGWITAPCCSQMRAGWLIGIAQSRSVQLESNCIYMTMVVVYMPL